MASTDEDLTECDVEYAILQSLADAIEKEFGRKSSTKNFNAASMLTSERGVVLRVGAQEFHIAISTGKRR